MPLAMSCGEGSGEITNNLLIISKTKKTKNYVVN